MGCSSSKAVEQISINKYVDTDDFKEEDFQHFQPNFYNINIKNIKKVYEERINEGNNIIVKIHKIFVTINYAKKNTTNIRIEIEKKDGQIIKKHLTKIIFDYECSFDNLKTLLEVYNTRFNIDSSQWYQLKHSTDIYIKAEKINNNLFKIFEMFYDKDEPSLAFNKIIKCGNSENSCEAICSKINPGEVVKKYNELKSIYYDNKLEIFNYFDNSRRIYPDVVSKRNNNNNNNNNNNKNNNNNNYNYNNYSNNNYNYNNYSNNSYNYNNNSNNYSSNNYNNNSNHDNNDSEEEKSNRSFRMADEYGNQLGRVDNDGVIRDEHGYQRGNFDNDGVIRDEHGYQRGNIDSDGVIRDEHGYQSGNVESDGTVRDEHGYQIGKIEDDGTVRDEHGYQIGKAEGMSKEQAAYLYFFNK